MPPVGISYVPARGIASMPPAGGRCPRTAQNIYNGYVCGVEFLNHGAGKEAREFKGFGAVQLD